MLYGSVALSLLQHLRTWVLNLDGCKAFYAHIQATNGWETGSYQHPTTSMFIIGAQYFGTTLRAFNPLQSNELF